jgi:hypothetical protein
VGLFATSPISSIEFGVCKRSSQCSTILLAEKGKLALV